MADRDGIYAWLAAKSFRFVRERDPARKVVERLVLEGRAEWLSHNRYRALPMKGTDT